VKVLVDTSAVLRFVVADDPRHQEVRERLEQLAAEGHALLFTPQIARECWVVLTRPRSMNGFGLSVEEASRLFGFAESALAMTNDLPENYDIWRRLVRKHAVSGKQAHDANHVAAMIAHGIEGVLTLDKRDFDRYPEIRVLAI
jgi:predicted nucleic acid-binding protein